MLTHDFNFMISISCKAIVCSSLRQSSSFGRSALQDSMRPASTEFVRMLWIPESGQATVSNWHFQSFYFNADSSPIVLVDRDRVDIQACSKFKFNSIKLKLSKCWRSSIERTVREEIAEKRRASNWSQNKTLTLDGSWHFSQFALC